MGGEADEPAGLEECADAQLDAGALAEGLVALAALAEGLTRCSAARTQRRALYLGIGDGIDGPGQVAQT